MSIPKSKKERLFLRRHRRVRKKVSGSSERPRLVVHRSHLHLEAQVVDDMAGKTLLSRSTRGKSAVKSTKGGSLEGAKWLGDQLGEAAVKQGIKKLVFDRSGYLYHGRIKALTEAVRAKGLQL
mgnify:CR=1 FL=1